MTLRVLVAYSASSTYVHATLEYVTALKRYSGLDVSFLHVTHDAVVELDVNAFDVVFHSYCARLCIEGYVSESYRSFLRRFPGLKVLAVQDEYEQTNVLKAAIRDLGFHVLITCVPADSLEHVFPRREFPNLRVEKGLTGYLPDSMVESAPTVRPLSQRPILIGYRARALPPYYGRLGQEKYEIGQQMAAACEERGLNHDISMDDSRKIYGDAWFEFIGSCRSMIGSETGSNLFDWDGSLKATYNQMVADRGGAHVSFDEFTSAVGDREQTVFMGEISPRVFECAVMRTPMILYPGRYSDAIEPGTHYIVLNKDFTNVDDVFRKLEDLPALERMADRAYDHLVVSGRFGFRAFAQRLRGLFEEELRQLNTRHVPVELRSREGPAVYEMLRTETPTEAPQSLDDFRRNYEVANFFFSFDEPQRVGSALRDQTRNYAAEVGRLAAYLSEARESLLEPNADRESVADLAKLIEHGASLAAAADEVAGCAEEFVGRAARALETVARDTSLKSRRRAFAHGLIVEIKAYLEKVSAEIVSSDRAFAALLLRGRTIVQMLEVGRLEVILRSHRETCLASARDLHRVYEIERGRLAEISRGRTTQPPILEYLAPLEDAAEDIKAAMFRRAVAELLDGGTLSDASSEQFEALSVIVKDRVATVNSEIVAFNALFSQYVASANEGIAEVGKLVKAAAAARPLTQRILQKALRTISRKGANANRA